MKEKINITSLKNIINAELKIIDERKIRSQSALYKLDIFKEIIELVSGSDINTIYDNHLAINALLPLVYESNEASYIGNEIYTLTYGLLKLASSSDLAEEYHKYAERLNKIIAKIINDYEILDSKLITYKREFKEDNAKTTSYRNILFKLKDMQFLTNEDIEIIKKLLNTNNYSREFQIIIMECIAHHNKRSKYELPEISYTTINMINNEFELYDVIDFIDKDTFDKLEEWVSYIFDTVMESDKLDYNELDDMTSWMSEDEYTYTLRCVMNKFLELVQKCKNNMLEEGNYEDIEIRKVIIAEYNSYYYKFLDLRKYYNQTLKELERDESIDLVDDEEYQQLEVKNNLFFAMSSSKAFIKKDILDVPEEYYQRIKKLLVGFKHGILSKSLMKNLVVNSFSNSYQELKEDQVRIVYRRLNNNNFLILGILVKKANNVKKDYINIFKRDYVYNIDTEEAYLHNEHISNEIYNNLIEYLDQYSRKGNR